MTEDDRLQRRADVLAARVEALAEALRTCGAPEEASAQLLSRASAAVLQALNLELLLEQPHTVLEPPHDPQLDLRLVA
jgi:ABC-type nitrate/sulfonate/bicarbonate transport system substrate-binding protein